MSDQHIQHLTRQYTKLREQGMSYGDIRKMLSTQGEAENVISAVIRQIDEHEREQVILKAERTTAVKQMWIGVFIIAVGVIMCLYTHFAQLLVGNKRGYWLLFGLIAYGFLRFRRAYRLYHQYELINE